MLKKAVLLFALPLAFTGKLYGQQLTNTNWALYDSLGTFFIYFHMDGDTLSYSSDNVSYTNVALYIENGNVFTIVDFPFGPCGSLDTGTYNFLVQNDTLFFTPISDACTSRETTLTEYTWVQFSLGITDPELATASLYPNPARERVFFESDQLSKEDKYVILDPAGKILLSSTCEVDKRAEIDISALPPGTYFLQIAAFGQRFPFVKD